jgi:hypothetical protein
MPVRKVAVIIIPSVAASVENAPDPNALSVASAEPMRPYHPI